MQTRVNSKYNISADQNLKRSLFGTAYINKFLMIESYAN